MITTPLRVSQGRAAPEERAAEEYVWYFEQRSDAWPSHP